MLKLEFYDFQLCIENGDMPNKMLCDALINGLDNTYIMFQLMECLPNISYGNSLEDYISQISLYYDHFSSLYSIPISDQQCIIYVLYTINRMRYVGDMATRIAYMEEAIATADEDNILLISMKYQLLHTLLSYYSMDMFNGAKLRQYLGLAKKYENRVNMYWPQLCAMTSKALHI